MKLTDQDKQVIEDFVNSEEGCRILDPNHFPSDHPKSYDEWVTADRWDLWLNALLARIGHDLPQDFVDYLLEDLADWEHQGNMRPWAEDETNDFGMTRWRFDTF